MQEEAADKVDAGGCAKHSNNEEIVMKESKPKSEKSLYDPMKGPSPDEWLAIDENERIGQVLLYHEDADIEFPPATSDVGHATCHVIVENQLSMGVEAVCRAIERLLTGGLDRHEAIHAISGVLLAQLWHVSRGDNLNQADYDSALENLTAESWREAVESQDQQRH